MDDDEFINNDKHKFQNNNKHKVQNNDKHYYVPYKNKWKKDSNKQKLDKCYNYFIEKENEKLMSLLYENEIMKNDVETEFYKNIVTSGGIGDEYSYLNSESLHNDLQYYLDEIEYDNKSTGSDQEIEQVKFEIEKEKYKNNAFLEELYNESQQLIQLNKIELDKYIPLE